MINAIFYIALLLSILIDIIQGKGLDIVTHVFIAGAFWLDYGMPLLIHSLDIQRGLEERQMNRWRVDMYSRMRALR